MFLTTLKSGVLPAHVLRKKTGKLASRSELCLFVGYPIGTKGCTFYSPDDKKMFVSTNTRFLELDYIKNRMPRSELVLKEMLDERAPASQIRTSLIPTEKEPLPEPSHTAPRRSGRVIRQPDRYMSYGEALVAVSDKDLDDPISYSEAMKSSKANLWQDAMNVEMQSLTPNTLMMFLEYVQRKTKLKHEVRLSMGKRDKFFDDEIGSVKTKFE